MKFGKFTAATKQSSTYKGPSRNKFNYLLHDFRTLFIRIIEIVDQEQVAQQQTVCFIWSNANEEVNKKKFNFA